MSRRLALVIACYAYQDPGLRRLTTPAQDAEALAAVLRDPRIAGFEVTTLVNEPHHRVGEAIAGLYRDRRRDDLTLLYFTGHGLKDDAGRLFLAMENTRRDSLVFTALSAEQVDQAMEGCASRQKILILDCCYSGAFPPGRLAKGDPEVHSLERFSGRGRAVLTASDATQYSFEGDRLRGEAAQSVFTRHLVEGLREGYADLDGDGDITVDELYAYVHERVVEEMPQQRPKKQDDVEGRIVIARNVHWTLPPQLGAALRSPIAADRLAALDGLAHLHRIGNDVVRAAVRADVERLTDDDSRLVSGAARERLAALAAQPPGPVALAAAPRGAPPVAGPAAGAAQPSGGPAKRGGRAGSRWALRRWPVDAVRGVWRHIGVVAGVLAAVAGAALAAGEVAWHGGRAAKAASSLLGNGSFFSAGPGPGAVLAWYTAGIALVATAGAVLALLPRTRSLTGPGVLVGGGAAAPFGLAFFAGDFRWANDFGGRPWVEIVGHAALALAAVCAGLALWRHPEARLRLGAPGDRVRRSALVLAVLGTLALLGQLAAVAAARRVEGDLEVWLAPLCAAVPAALLVPAGAVAATSRRLARSLLAGWAAGGAAILASVFALAFGRDSIAPAPAVAFACTLALLASAARSWPVAAAGPVPPPRRHARALLLIVPLFAVLTAAAGTAVVVRYDQVPILMSSVAVSPDGARLYAVGDITFTGGTRMWTIDAATGRVIGGPVALGNGYQAFYQVALTVDGRRAYVTRQDTDTVRTVDTATGAVAGRPISVGKWPAGIAMAADGRRAYVTNRASDSVSVIDTATGGTVGDPIPVGDEPLGIVAAPDGRRVYVADSGSDQVSVIDTATGRAGAPIPTGDRPGGLAISRDGGHLYVSTGGIWNLTDEGFEVIETATGKTVGRRLDVGLPTMSKGGLFTGWSGVAVSPNGGEVYLTDGWSNAVVTVDLAYHRVLPDAIKVGEHATAIVASPDGRYLYVATADGISIVDLSTRTSELVTVFG
ncbi:caspase family protein [Sphaerisporangium sp. NPDC005288]|uniref:caspase, EACC1-associated type n=1 Tax=Sphaerisporangium sp. NPDC005288 TaxID=3155114 RepID=UPI0033B98F70